ncbi:MAG: N-acetyltransferase [Emcibacter sp.]|nr:N-acetyltransferase [Emcibacter sp.]
MLDQAFGADRQKKTAYRLRDGVPAAAGLSFITMSGADIIASLQFWPLLIKDNDRSYAALLLGPIAVDNDYRGQGIGLDLMAHGLQAAKEQGHKRVILVGDEIYYKKVGFSRALALGLEMPGPVDKARLLAQELVPDAFKGVKGMISKIK